MLGDYLIQSGSKLLSFDQQHAHFLTPRKKTIFRLYLHQQWETSQTQLAGTETNIKEVPSSLKTNLPQLVPPQSVSKGQNKLTISMAMNKTCQLPILV